MPGGEKARKLENRQAIRRDAKTPETKKYWVIS